MKSVISAAALTALSLCTGAHAADIKINGFASFAAGKTLNEYGVGDRQAEFEADQPSDSIYTDQWSFKPDSLYGLQITSDIEDGLSVVGQIIGTGGENYDAKVVWAYAKYEVNDNLEVMAGRQRLPLYFYSDVLDVGYSYHWMRPPTDGSLPTDVMDGVQARYEFTLGGWDSRVQAFTGESINEESVGLDSIVGAVAFASNDWLQLRASVMEADVYFDPPQGIDHPQARENSVGGFYQSYSANATLGDMFIVAETTRNNIEKPLYPFSLKGLESYFVSIGYQFGDLTPHITVSQQQNNILVLNPADGSVVMSDTFTDNSIIAGLRWDFHKKAAFKVEYQHRADDDKEARSQLYSAPELAAFVSNDFRFREVDLVSFGIDVIF